jgi:drug/metabolite transporter (DMT)-like permease
LETALVKPKSVARLTRGYGICLIATVLWSTTAIFIRYLTETYRMPPLVLAFWRDIILAAALLLVFVFFAPHRLRLERAHIPFMIAYGLILALFNSLWTISVALNGAAVSTVLAYSSAAFTAVLGWKLFNESLGWQKIGAVTLSLLGCVFVSGAYDLSAWLVNPLGVVTGLASGMAFAAYSLMGKGALGKNINPWTVLFYAFGIGALFIFSFNLFHLKLPAGVASPDLFWLGGALAGWVVLISLAIGPTIGGYGLYTVSLTYLPASVANVIATLEPAMTAALAFAILGERFTPPQWVGSALIVSGVIVLRLGEQRQAPEVSLSSDART